MSYINIKLHHNNQFILIVPITSNRKLFTVRVFGLYFMNVRLGRYN